MRSLGNSIDYKDHINKFTIKADPLQALLNEKYFIDIVQKLIAAHLTREELG